MKIAIIGYSGSGKSTLAAWLGEQYTLPVLHLDRVHWLPGWQQRSREEKRAIVAQFLADNDRWVIDGNYARVEYDRRMEEADRIIFMDFGRFPCLWRAVRRYFTYRGKTRASMTEGCPEKMDREFLLWLLRDGRTREIRARYRETCERHSGKVTVIKNQRQLDRFYAAQAKKQAAKS